MVGRRGHVGRSSRGSVHDRRSAGRRGPTSSAARERRPFCAAREMASQRLGARHTVRPPAIPPRPARRSTWRGFMRQARPRRCAPPVPARDIRGCARSATTSSPSRRLECDRAAFAAPLLEILARGARRPRRDHRLEPDGGAASRAGASSRPPRPAVTSSRATTSASRAGGTFLASPSLHLIRPGYSPAKRRPAPPRSAPPPAAARTCASRAIIRHARPLHRAQPRQQEDA